MDEVNWLVALIPSGMVVTGVLITIFARRVAALNAEALKALGTRSAQRAVPRSTVAQFRVAGVVLALGGLAAFAIGLLSRLP